LDYAASLSGGKTAGFQPNVDGALNNGETTDLQVGPLGPRLTSTGRRVSALRRNRRQDGALRHKRTGQMAMAEKRKWSQDVTQHSDALDLENGVFSSNDPKHIADSLKRSAEHSHRRKGTPYQSAMSMLTFYINRAGRDLLAARRRVLEAAKDELRKDFGRDQK
jgi:Protein of unknown function (DUF3175)